MLSPDARSKQRPLAELNRTQKTPPERGFHVKRLKGLEPSTFCMASRRSSQLSYSREVAEYSPGAAYDRGSVRTPFSITTRVRYAECDMQGHVFNAHYLTWFDMAHTALLRTALSMSYREMLASGTDVVVAESGVRYLAPAHLEDELEIAVEPEPLGRTSMTSRFTVRRQDTPIAEGFLRHVCVNPQTLEKRPWPEPVREALSPYVISPA